MSAPAAPAVHLATCDFCSSTILGDRYKCLSCPDFDTCSSCFRITEEQHPKHAFVRIHKQEDYLPLTDHATPRRRHYASCDGCSETIYGSRFKCMHSDCPDYDLCEKCESLPIPVHPDDHPMLKIKIPETVIRSSNLSLPPSTSDPLLESPRMTRMKRLSFLTSTSNPSLCVVCQDEDADMAIITCGHMALCNGCSDTIMESTRQCPLCRIGIATKRHIIRIFRA